MLTALFKPKRIANKEGTLVWGKLIQIEVPRDEVEAYKDDGWLESAADALDAHDIDKLEQDNASLKSQIEAEQKKLDGRSAEARALKAAKAAE